MGWTRLAPSRPGDRTTSVVEPRHLAGGETQRCGFGEFAFDQANQRTENDRGRSDQAGIRAEPIVLIKHVCNQRLVISVFVDMSGNDLCAVPEPFAARSRQAEEQAPS